MESLLGQCMIGGNSMHSIVKIQIFIKKHETKLLVVVVVLSQLILCSIWKKKQIWDYYQTKDCFISSSGTITFIYHDATNQEICLSLSDIDPRFDDRRFVITGMNYTIVMERGLLDDLSIGDSVEFIGAPRVFWDGYVLPMIEITVDDEQFLDAKTGYDHFIEWLRATL